MSDTGETGIEERVSISSVNTTAQKQGMGKKAVAVLVFLGLAGLLVWSTWEPENGKDVADDRNRPGSIRVQQPFTPAPEPTMYTPAIIEQPKKQPDPVKTVEEVKKTNELLEASRRAPVLAFTGRIRSKSTEASPQSATLNVGLPAGLLGATAPTDQDSLATRLKSTTLTGTKAQQIANLHMTVPKGTHIPCTLETAMSSDQPGLVSCIVARDVLGGSGQVVLIEKGSKTFGEYKGGLKRGQKRLFVLWTEVRTPKGVVVTLDSPATDAIGRAGVTGKIDKKFWQRFGGALLLSVVSDASGFVFERASEEINVDFNSTSETPDDAVTKAIEQTANIKPTLYKHQGEAVNIFVARDLDFSEVYRLRRTESANQIYDRVNDSDIYELPLVIK